MSTSTRHHGHRQSPARQRRAHLAKTTLTTTIPAVLAASPRAQSGLTTSTLTTDVPRVPRASRPPTLSITPADTYSVGRSLQALLRRVAVLNMASCWKPGGGWLSGSLAQEESLCMRSTLYAALKREWYPLPDVCAVYTKDVCVFRDEELRDMQEGDWFYLDVVSAAAVCRPKKEVVGTEDYRALWREKMRCVMGSVVAAGVNGVVLGAWGCGAYGNPVREVVEAWREVLTEEWRGVERVVFAVLDRNMAREFLECWGEGLEWVEDMEGNNKDGAPNIE